MTISGHDIYVPRLIQALSKIPITAQSLRNLSELDVNDIEDIQVPQTFLGLPTWWNDLLEHPHEDFTMPSNPADINAALSEYAANHTKV